uniref:Uncharacterized protein n=1 Tax=Timema shepardi TaxID=629360 RepID=A0A7R9FYE6_TIMSH|nr:unnamed protein product [Timema shepardi]
MCFSSLLYKRVQPANRISHLEVMPAMKENDERPGQRTTRQVRQTNIVNGHGESGVNHSRGLENVAPTPSTPVLGVKRQQQQSVARQQVLAQQQAAAAVAAQQGW